MAANFNVRLAILPITQLPVSLGENPWGGLLVLPPRAQAGTTVRFLLVHFCVSALVCMGKVGQGHYSTKIKKT